MRHDSPILKGHGYLNLLGLLTAAAFGGFLFLISPGWLRPVSAQAPAVKAQARDGSPPTIPQCQAPTPQTIYAPTIGMPEIADARIVFNSRSDTVMDVHTTFYTADGAPVAGPVVSLQPAEIRTVELASLLPTAQRGRTRWGGIALAYNGKVFDVWAQIMLLGAEHSGSTDVTFSVLNGRGSDVQDAVWWMPPGSRATLALGNSSDTALQTTLRFANGDSQTVHIAPYATEYVRLRARNGNNTHELLDGRGESVRLNTTGPAGSLKAAGLVTTAAGRLLSSIRFYDTLNAGQPHLFATNMRLRGYSPRIVLKNTSATTISAQPRFRPAAGEGGIPVELTPVTLAPGEIAELNLDPLLSAAAGRADLDAVSVQIINSGAPGSLIGALNGSALRTEATYDVPLRDPGPNRSNTGAYPWRIDGDFSTVASVTNVSDTPARFIAELYYPGGRYLFGPHPLAAGATALFDLKQIRDQRVPDANGDRLPANVMSGQFRWRWFPGPNAPHLIGRATVTSRTQGISASYSCMANCGANGPSYLIDGFTTVPTGGYGMLHTREQWCGASGGCDVYNTNISGPVDDPTVASLEATSTGWLKQNGLSIGETFWSFSYWYGYEYDDGFDCRFAQDEVTTTQPVTVVCAVPTNYHQVGSGVDNGGILHFEYAWESSTGNLADLSACTVGEIVTYPGSGSTFSWPNPPFSRSNSNPVVIDLPATDGALADNHSGPNSFVKPYSTSSFTATQHYRYKCPCSNGGNYVNLVGPISIVRSVSQNANGSWKYTITKSSASATINPLP